jgi:phosphotriesterase-related protein
VARIETLAGPLDASQLGTTLMHEHVFIYSPEVQLNYPGTTGWDEEHWLGVAREKLTELKAGDARE